MNQRARALPIALAGDVQSPHLRDQCLQSGRELRVATCRRVRAPTPQSTATPGRPNDRQQHADGDPLLPTIPDLRTHGVASLSLFA